jgi:hypothetical protein
MSRTCGTCKACCIYLGIEELGKLPATPCKHLTKVRIENCCSIYSNRPIACRTYSCAWLSGLFADHMRPDRSGLLVSIYKREDLDEGISVEPENVGQTLAATIAIADKRRSGDLQSGALHDFIAELTNRGLQDIRIVDYTNRNVIHLFEGIIRLGKLHDPDPSNPEALSFETFDPPLGTFGLGAKINDSNGEPT